MTSISRTLGSPSDAALLDASTLRRQFALSIAVVVGLALAFTSAVATVTPQPATVDAHGIAVPIPASHADTNVSGARPS